MDWKANWIWISDDPHRPDTYIYARRTFDLEEKPSGVAPRASGRSRARPAHGSARGGEAPGQVGAPAPGRTTGVRAGARHSPARLLAAPLACRAAGSAWLSCTADSRYELYVNGRFLGRGPARYHFETPHYDRYEISALLRPGRNVIAFLARHFGTPTYCFMPVRGALIGQLEVQSVGAQGPPRRTPLLLVTDESWRVRRAEAYPPHGGRLGTWQGYAEVCDGRLIPREWKGPEFDDSDWEKATVLGPAKLDPWKELVERDIPHPFYYRLPAGSVREIGISAPPLDMDPRDPPSVAVLLARSEQLGQGTTRVENRCAAIYPTEECTIIHPPSFGEAVYMVVDFDREVSGFPHIEVEGEAGAIVDVAYAERLVDGRVTCGPFLDLAENHEFHYADRYILGGGSEIYQPMEPRAFRYMHLEFRNHTQPVKLKSVAVMFSTYPVEYRGSFECADHLLEQIWDMGNRTTELCMYDAFMDCPWRGRSQWWANARIEALVAYYAFGDGLLVRKGLKEIAQSQRPDGALCALYPSQADCVVPGDACAWVCSLWEYHLFRDDPPLLLELYPVLQRAMEWLEGFRGEDGLLKEMPYWNFIDWGELLEGQGVASLNCFYYAALRDAAAIARAVGDRGGEATYQQRATRTSKAINERLWVEELGGYVEDPLTPRSPDDEKSRLQDERDLVHARLPRPRAALSPMPTGPALESVGRGGRLSQHANALAVAMGIARDERADRILDRILDADPSMVPIATPYFAFYLLQALYRRGRHQDALNFIRRRWGCMLDAGATTTWELWRPTASLCHGWSAGPTHDLMAEVLGVRPTAPGFARFQVHPHTADLSWAKGVVPSPRGEIAVSWVGGRGADSFMLRVTVPEGTIAQICIPEEPCGHWRSIDLDGAPASREGKILASAVSVQSGWIGEAGHVFEVGPGEHLFEARA